MRYLWVAIAAALVFPAYAVGQTTPRASSKQQNGSRDARTKTPIKHVITLMQENHSFDNYFGTYPGADGIRKRTCMPRSLNTPRGRCVKPFRIGNRAIDGLNHSAGIFRVQHHGGRMDGFVAGLRRATGRTGAQTMGYYDDRDIPFYWNVADNYTLFDRFFASATSGAVRNHMYWTTGTPGDPSADGVPKGGFGNLPTIFDRLQKRGISWKFYVENYDPAITFRSKSAGDRGAQLVGVPLLNYARYIDNPRLFKRIVPISEYYEDLQRGTLPAVAYVASSGSSEHPPGSIKAGETLVRTMVTALMRSSAWSSSAFTWTYDHWGGWYDHVKPPQVDAFGYGFRVPALVVSAWSKRGYVGHRTLDHTSILKFIERNWGLKPLASRDRRANSIADAFDFKAGPREPVILSAARGVATPKEPRRNVVIVLYGSALLLASAVIAVAMLWDRRRAGPHEPDHGTATA